MARKREDFEPLNEVWLSIVSAVSTALLVTVLTEFSFQVMPIIQVVVLSFACTMIGLYARKKSDGLMAITKRIELEHLSGPEKIGARRKVLQEEWGLRRRFLTQTMVATLVFIAISVSLLFYKGWVERKSLEADVFFRSEVSKELQELKTAVDSLGRQGHGQSASPGASKR